MPQTCSVRCPNINIIPLQFFLKFNYETKQKKVTYRMLFFFSLSLSLSFLVQGILKCARVCWYKTSITRSTVRSKVECWLTFWLDTNETKKLIRHDQMCEAAWGRTREFHLSTRHNFAETFEFFFSPRISKWTWSHQQQEEKRENIPNITERQYRTLPTTFDFPFWLWDR